MKVRPPHLRPLIQALTPSLKRSHRGSQTVPARYRRDLRQGLDWNLSGNVLGFGIGPKWQDGHVDQGTTCLVIFVAQKLARGKVPKGELIPRRLRAGSIDRAIQTDVIQIGSIPQFQASPSLQPGVNAAHFTMQMGTLTAAVRSRTSGQLLLLSCCHGFAPLGVSGPQVESPPDLGRSTMTNWVADVVAAHPLRPGGSAANIMDAAVAAPHPDIATRTTNQIPGRGRITSASSLVSGQFRSSGIRTFAGFGAATSQVRGEIMAENASTLIADPRGRVYLFQNLVAYSPRPITKAGDSGMPLVVATPSGLHLIGMHIGVSSVLGAAVPAAFFVPIRLVLDKFGLVLAP